MSADINLLTAKWLDPECHNGCQSIVYKNKLEALAATHSTLLVAMDYNRKERDDLAAQLKQLRWELAEMVKDKARLDWLEVGNRIDGCYFMEDVDGDHFLIKQGQYNDGEGRTFREAIDSAAAQYEEKKS